jgi:hypothetical protein
MRREEAELRRAQGAAEQARRLLLSPSPGNLDRSRACLEQACACLEEVRSALGRPGSGGRELLPALSVLRQTARRAAALFEGAAGFHTGWTGKLPGAATCGYTRQGAPAACALPPGLSVEG